MVTTQPRAPATYLRHPTADKAREVSVSFDGAALGNGWVVVSAIGRGDVTARVYSDDPAVRALARSANSGDALALGVLADRIEDGVVRYTVGGVNAPAAVAAALRSACEHALYREDLGAGADRPDAL